MSCKHKTLGCLLGLGLLSGCAAVGPDYVRPPVEMPANWRIEYGQAVELANSRWWEQFGDPVLNRLVEAGLRENLDLLLATTRLDQYAGQLRSSRSQAYPQLSYGGSAGSNRTTEHGFSPLADSVSPWYGMYQASLGAEWQIDLFGKLRRQNEAAAARLLASEQGRRAVVLSVVSSITTNYISLRALDRQLEIARATATNYGETLELFRQRYEGGVISELELFQIDSQYQEALASIPALEAQVAVQEHLLALLLGRAPGPLERGGCIDEFLSPVVPAGLPAELLIRRPDIRQAEQNLIAANAEIGVAKAQYYPSISLTGMLGSASTALGDFLRSSASVVELAAGVSGSLFTFGSIEGQVETAEAAQRQALLLYRQTILNALREVNDALIGTQKKGEETAAQQKRVEALRQYARLAHLRFDQGVSSYLDVLVAENGLFAAELTVVRRQAEYQARLVDLYGALGGGWIDEADRLAPMPQTETARTVKSAPPPNPGDDGQAKAAGH